MKIIKLWEYNKITGYWNIIRECNAETAEKWLDIFKKDKPEALFKLSYNKPKFIPEKALLGNIFSLED